MSGEAARLYREGLRKHRDKDYDGAVRLLREAVAADPGLADAWEALGVLLEKTGDLDGAIQATERLLELDPDQIMGFANLSRFFMKKGWIEKAEEAQSRARLLGWKQDLGRAPGADDLVQVPDPSSTQGVVLAELVEHTEHPAPPSPDPGMVQQRIDQFEAVLAMRPDDAMTHLSLGKVYLQAGRTADAIRVLERALELQEDYSAVFLVLGQAQEAAGQLARALKTWQKGVAVAEAKGDLHPRNHMKEALARFHRPGS